MFKTVYVYSFISIPYNFGTIRMGQKQLEVDLTFHVLDFEMDFQHQLKDYGPDQQGGASTSLRLLDQMPAP